MTAQFWVGVLAVPAAAAIIYALLLLAHVVGSAWSSWRPTLVGQTVYRARVAAAVAVARRVLSIRLPGGWVLVYRERTGDRFVGDMTPRELAREVERTLTDLAGNYPPK